MEMFLCGNLGLGQTAVPLTYAQDEAVTTSHSPVRGEAFSFCHS